MTAYLMLKEKHSITLGPTRAIILQFVLTPQAYTAAPSSEETADLLICKKRDMAE